MAWIKIRNNGNFEYVNSDHVVAIGRNSLGDGKWDARLATSRAISSLSGWEYSEDSFDEVLGQLIGVEIGEPEPTETAAMAECETVQFLCDKTLHTVCCSHCDKAGVSTPLVKYLGHWACPKCHILHKAKMHPGDILCTTKLDTPTDLLQSGDYKPGDPEDDPIIAMLAGMKESGVNLKTFDWPKKPKPDSWYKAYKDSAAGKAELKPSIYPPEHPLSDLHPDYAKDAWFKQQSISKFNLDYATLDELTLKSPATKVAMEQAGLKIKSIPEPDYFIHKKPPFYSVIPFIVIEPNVEWTFWPDVVPGVLPFVRNPTGTIQDLVEFNGITGAYRFMNDSEFVWWIGLDVDHRKTAISTSGMAQLLTLARGVDIAKNGQCGGVNVKVCGWHKAAWNGPRLVCPACSNFWSKEHGKLIELG